MKLSAIAFEQICFQDEAAAHAFVEGVVWPDGPVCPRCGENEHIQSIRANPEKRVRYGLKNCGRCDRQFTVRMGTVFENTKLPLTIWLKALFVALSETGDLDPRSLREAMGVTSITAKEVTRRLDQALVEGKLSEFKPLTAARCC
jgi:transposase-like protein